MKSRRTSTRTGGINPVLPDTVNALIDPLKRGSLWGEVTAGINNTILLQKFPGYRWPAWISGSDSGKSSEPLYSNPVLLNTADRGWQILTNYLAEDELKISNYGMISGPGSSNWSLEFWIYSRNLFHTPGENRQNISAARSTSTGELEVSGTIKGISFVERITGGKSNINEAVVSFRASSRSDMTGSTLLLVVRPYNTFMLGGLSSIEFTGGSGLVRLNGRAQVASLQSPDHIIAGSGSLGDITPEMLDEEPVDRIDCPFSLATMALAFNLTGNSAEHNFRISLEAKGELSAAGLKRYEDNARDFRALIDLRLGEGMLYEIPDDKYKSIMDQSRLSMLCVNTGDLMPLDMGRARSSYFYVYGLVRAGLMRDAENIAAQMVEKTLFNEKRKDFSTAIIAAYTVSAFNELYIHKRETDYLQKMFPELRRIGDYVYSFCCDIHNPASLNSNTLKYCWIGTSMEHDIFVFYLAMSAMAYLSRCMGIFGHESKYRNEAERLQALIRDTYDKKRRARILKGSDFKGLIYFPERLYMAPGEEEYTKLFRNLFISDDFPIMDRVFGIDMFCSFAVLNQMLAIRDSRFHEFCDKLFSYIDSFFTLPEYVNPVSGRGAWGDGNSKEIASMIFVVLRNTLFIDTSERLEFFPVPYEKLFSPGKRIRIEKAPSRFGPLSFLIESTESEIRFAFTELPKYVPSDILINLPFDTKILEGDDFIVKKRVNHSYYINGWPSAVRFQVLRDQHGK